MMWAIEIIIWRAGPTRGDVSFALAYNKVLEAWVVWLNPETCSSRCTASVTRRSTNCGCSPPLPGAAGCWCCLLTPLPPPPILEAWVVWLHACCGLLRLASWL